MGCPKILRFVPFMLAVAGCAPSENASWVPHKEVAQLNEKLQSQLLDHLTKYCGTAANPKLLGSDENSQPRLLQGELVFNKHCAPCHGASGDGAGKAAEYLDPRPRDYRRGAFKFTSTPYGAKPLRADLVRTVRNGAIV